MATGFTPYDPANPDRKLMDSVCQAAAENCDATSQTTWFRSVHASVQYSTMHYEQEEVGGTRRRARESCSLRAASVRRHPLSYFRAKRSCHELSTVGSGWYIRMLRGIGDRLRWCMNGNVLPSSATLRSSEDKREK